MSRRMMRVYAASLDRYLTETMLRYGAETAYDISEAIRQIGDEAKEKVIAASPKNKGRYRRGWRVDFNSKGWHIRCVIHQKKPTYRLTHLLEDGHRTRGGHSRTKAQPHIRPVEEWAEKAALDAVAKAVKG